MTRLKSIPRPLAALIGLDLALAVAAAALATVNLAIGWAGFAQHDAGADATVLILVASQTGVAAILLWGSLQLWRGRERGLVATAAAITFVGAIASQEAQQGDVALAAALFAWIAAAVVCGVNRATRGALSREGGGAGRTPSSGAST